MLLGVTVLWVAQLTSEMYSQEVTQKLNGSIAMYVTQQQQLISNGVVNQGAMDVLAQRTMTINPTVEVYLTDPSGKIISHVIPANEVTQKRVSLKPIQQFLSGEATFPIFGDDPRNKGVEKVFSVSPVMENSEVVGYLYAVLGGKKYDSLKTAVEQSYILQMGAITIIGSLILAVFAALTIFFFLTRRLRALRTRVENFQADYHGNSDLLAPLVIRDEIDQLSASFHEMARHIRQQFEALESLDATRRELIANVSHDLRTPLASMQGYIETLIIKGADLPEETKKQYLETAYKHSQRLNSLIAELFELARLDSGAIKLNAETFSLSELVHDCVQDFSLAISEKEIDVTIESDIENCYVNADIALIQRVLQNLLDNALRHTPPQHNVTIRIKDSDARAVIEIADTGRGIAKHEIPHIFERFYYSPQNQPRDKINSGLGLAIVKRILELHKSQIAVKSEVDQGTSFTFELPMPA
jgi:signal transduction histidine kinase